MTNTGLDIFAMTSEHQHCDGEIDTYFGKDFDEIVCTGCATVIATTPHKQLTPTQQQIQPTTLPDIDTTRILTPDEINAHIADCVLRLEHSQAFHQKALEEQYEAAIEYEIAYARALANTKGGASDQRKAQALIACEKELQRKNLADLKAKTITAATHDIRAALSGYQTLAKSIQTTYNTYK